LLPVQLKVVPGIDVPIAIEIEVPLHTVCDEGFTVSTGLGFTTTDTFKVSPAQPAARGTIEYVTVIFVVSVIYRIVRNYAACSVGALTNCSKYKLNLQHLKPH
jgi:hypothetical protein